MKTQNMLNKASLLTLGLGLVCGSVHGQANISANAISLDGTSGYLSLPSGTWFSGDFTVEAWVYVRSYNNWSRLIDFADGPDNYNVYLALSHGTTGQPAMGVFTNNNYLPVLQASSQLPLNHWAHLAATLSGTTAKIFINGQVVGSGTLNSPPAVTRTNIYIGRSAYAPDGYANAMFDEIRIWNVARTPNQIQQSMNHNLSGTETGLIGYWRCDEGTGTSAFDSTSNGRTATLVGGASWTNSGALLTLPSNYALSFSNQSVSIPHQAALNAYPLTVMCWFLAPTNTSGGALVNKYVSSSYNGWQMFISGGHLLGWYFRDSFDNVFNGGPMDAGPVNDGGWHHAAMVIDASGGRLYLDGTVRQSLAWSGAAGPATTSIPLEFGIYPGDSAWTGGELDEVSIWNASLTTAQVQNDMLYALQGNEPGLVAYYRLNEGIGANAFDYTTNLNTGTLSTPPPTSLVSGALAYSVPSITVLQGPTLYNGNSTTVSASVNPNGFPTTVWLSQGQTVTTTNLLGAIGRGYNGLTVSGIMTNLPPNTWYRYSFIASNTAGTVQSAYYYITNPGPPVIANVAAGPAFGNTTLSASVNPNGLPSSVWFLYGTTASYGVTDLVANLPFGVSAVPVSEVLSNLPVQTTYHFTVIASNTFGITLGGDVVFQPYILGATTLLEGPQGGMDSVELAGVPSSQAWTASVDVPWLHLNSYTNGLGSQTVVFSFEANPGAPRTGSIHFGIGTQAVTITQAGATYSPAAAVLELYSSSNYLYGPSLDRGNNIYLTDHGTTIMKVDSASKATSVVYSNPDGCYYLGVDAATNLYFFDRYADIFELHFGSSTPVLLSSFVNLTDIKVAPSGDVFVHADWNTNIYLLQPQTGNVNRLLGVDSSLYYWAVDAQENLYLHYFTNAMGAGTIFKWSPANPVLTPLFRTYSPGPITVDGSGNVYLSTDYNQILKWQAATATISYITETNWVDEFMLDNWGSMFASEFDASGYHVREEVRAYVDSPFVVESAGAGADSIAPVLPGTTYLGGQLTPTSSAPWLTVNGVTNGTVTFSFTAFNGSGNRTAYLNVLGVHIPIIQGNPSYSLLASSTVEGSAAGTDKVMLAVYPPSAGWTATTNSPWLHLGPGMQAGAGSGQIVFSFDANPGPTRTGSLTLGDQTFSITQAGAPYVAVTNLVALGTITNYPQSMVVDGSGNVFAGTFLYNNSMENLAEWVRAGNSVLFTNMNTPAPLYLSADWLGNVYLDNTSAFPFVVQQYNPVTGTFSTILSTSQYEPLGFVVDSRGNVIFYDGFTRNLIQHNQATGDFQTVAWGPFEAQGMTIDPVGNVFWLAFDYPGYSVMEWNAASRETSVLATHLYCYSMAAAPDGDLYLIDLSAQNVPQVQKLSPTSGLLTTVPLPAWVSADTISVDVAGNLYITSAASAGVVLYELPRAFVDSTPKIESAAGGHDALAPVLPANADLLPPFAPTSDQAWLTVSGITNGVINFAFSSTASARAGNLVVLGENILVSQGTNSWLGTPNLTEGPGAGSDSFVFGMIPANRPWNTTVSALWLHVPVSGVGGGNIIFSFDANSGPTRSGTITIGGQTLTVTQAGASYVLASPPTTLTDYYWGNNAPCGIALDAAGNVYYCDTYNNAVKVWSPTNNQLRVLGSTGFNIPYALAVDGVGNVYIADTYNNVLKKWSPATSNITTVVTGLSTPFGVAVDSANNVYISDSGHDSIKKWFTATSGMVTIYSLPGSRPTGVAVDAVGNVYWVEAGSGAVRKWSFVNNSVTTLFTGQFNEPHGVAVDGSGNVYVADYPSATYKWTAASATVGVTIGDTIGVAVDGSGNVFIADAWDWMIYEVPRTFVNLTPRLEPLTGGSDLLPPVLPVSESLLAPFAPVANQPWVSINGVVGGQVQFSVSPTASLRSATISVYGQAIPIIQANSAVPPTLAGVQRSAPGVLQFTFTNNPNAVFTVLASTNAALPLAQWTVLGPATNVSTGVYQFTDLQATNAMRFYKVRSP